MRSGDGARATSFFGLFARVLFVLQYYLVVMVCDGGDLQGTGCWNFWRNYACYAVPRDRNRSLLAGASKTAGAYNWPKEGGTAASEKAVTQERLAGSRDITPPLRNLHA